MMVFEKLVKNLVLSFDKSVINFSVNIYIDIFDI